MQEQEVERRGRKRGPRVPKEMVQTLKPKHENIILLHLAGLKNVEIAATLGITAQTVSNILGDEKAVELIEAGRDNIRKNLTTAMEDKLLVLANKSLDNLQKTVEADISVKHRAKVHQDRVGVDLLKLMGYGEKKNDNAVANPITNEIANRLASALERAETVREIEIEEAEVIEEIPTKEKEKKIA